MLITEYRFGEVKNLASQIEPETDKVKFHRIYSNDNGGVGLLAFKAGQALETHTAAAEVMVTVLEGEIKFTMFENVNTMRAGDFLLMGADVPHSVAATTDAKVMLTKLKP